MAKNEPKALTITAEKLCALTGLTDRRHRQLAKEGFFPPPIRGEYQLTPTIQGLFRHYREMTQRARSALDDEKKTKMEVDRKLAEAKLKEQRMENELRQGTMINLDAAIAVAERAAFAIRQRIKNLSLPEKEKRDLLADIHALGETDFTDVDSVDEDDDDTDAGEAQAS